jgi:hypothetical protein
MLIAKLLTTDVGGIDFMSFSVTCPCCDIHFLPHAKNWWDGTILCNTILLKIPFSLKLLHDVFSWQNYLAKSW